MKQLVIGLLLICATAKAQVVAVDVSGLQGTYLLTVQGGNVTVAPITLVRPGPGPSPIPTPVPIPTPDGTLASIVKTSAAAIPDYPGWETDQRSMAVAISFLSPFLGSVSVSDGRATIRSACDGAVGPADVPKWAPFWAAVDSKLNTMNLTPQKYQAALNEIAAALTDDLPAAEALDPNRGLPPEVWQMLLKLLLELLTKLFENK